MVILSIPGNFPFFNEEDASIISFSVISWSNGPTEEVLIENAGVWSNLEHFENDLPIHPFWYYLQRLFAPALGSTRTFQIDFESLWLARCISSKNLQFIRNFLLFNWFIHLYFFIKINSLKLLSCGVCLRSSESFFNKRFNFLQSLYTFKLK